ncbi:MULTISPECIES: hypothetical protein [Vibrio]|jgi:hypothetical protein|uniref:Uncharacterized protein n=2 Tax=Vibrio TaxID=662 RepID=A0ACD5G3Q9_9VIBR|nr:MULTISPECIES: hypothetical protein [Vibrio]MDA0155479.1 hypothetical protein [Vibrio sp. Makdt]MDC5725633.1 hypothetical protein [Vibrio europaeus]MDC5728235.1 hypothetical protein [Vibrio europaeus]MDC5734447.1 hypothetical protein [Vibrio europaeus]MDC5739728.1 hypothetical protein [Vibrio europaeus]
MEQFMTVVFKFQEGASLPKKLTQAFCADSKYEDVEITAISCDDEISRVEQLESDG